MKSTLNCQYTMERIWNLVYYFVYKWDYKMHLLFNQINPFMLIHRLSFLKRLYSKRGIDIKSEINEAYRRPDMGISSIFSGGFMYVLIFLLCWGLMNTYSAILHKEPNIKCYLIVIFILISITINQLLLFKKDKYLGYFQKFDEMPKKD